MIESMIRRARSEALTSVLLVYLIFCFVWGGSTNERIYTHGLLNATAGFGSTLLVLTWPKGKALGAVRYPIGFVTTAALIGLMQCVPIPAIIWEQLSGRSVVLEGYEALGVSVDFIPLSLDVEATLFGIGYALNSIFVLLLCARIGLHRLRTVFPIFLSTVAVVTVVIGLAQVFSGAESVLYIYENTNHGFPVGSFSNVNHFGSFLLMIIPNTVLLIQAALSMTDSWNSRLAKTTTVTSAFLIIFVGVAASGSLAVYCLFFPCVGLAFWGARARVRSARLQSFGVLTVVFIAFFGIILAATSPNLFGLGALASADGATSRQNIWSYTLTAIQQYWPIGTGGGTYQGVITQFEDPSTVTSTYIALAHNEYLQVILEFGVLGAAFIVVALTWFSLRVKSIWAEASTRTSNHFRKMAIIGILICLAHSVVDYPARTPAIASLLTCYVGVICLPTYRPDSERRESKMGGLRSLTL